MNQTELYNFYYQQLTSNFLPYWQKHIDQEHYGILNCLNNYGNSLVSNHKFTWSQGRFLWLLGELWKNNITYPQMKQDMDLLYNFLTRYSVYDDFRCCFLLEQDGTKILDLKTDRYDTSIYADCFTLIGLSQYISLFPDSEKELFAEKLYYSIRHRLETSDFLTEPYPIPDGYRVHGIPMIMIHTTHCFIHMKQVFHMDVANEIAYVFSLIQDIFTHFVQDNLIREYIPCHPSKDISTNRMLDRHRNPGHTLEDLWFILDFLKEFDNVEHYLPKIICIARHTLEYGWDQEFGGLFRYIDCSGGQPKGESIGDSFENQLIDTWDMKLWWPHSEALYTTLYLYKLTQLEEFKHTYERIHRYTFSTFPNHELGEWIQIRQRNGQPEEKVVALPVKDPFHIMRNFLKIIELCQDNPNFINELSV